MNGSLLNDIPSFRVLIMIRSKASSSSCFSTHFWKFLLLVCELSAQYKLWFLSRRSIFDLHMASCKCANVQLKSSFSGLHAILISVKINCSVLLFVSYWRKKLTVDTHKVNPIQWKCWSVLLKYMTLKASSSKFVSSLGSNLVCFHVDSLGLGLKCYHSIGMFNNRKDKGESPLTIWVLLLEMVAATS